MNKKILVSIILLFTILQTIIAQCEVNNTFFKNGEKLVYQMKFKLGFTTSNAGSLNLSVQEGTKKVKGHHKMTFMTNTSGFASKFYHVSDTLYAYMTEDLKPLVYIKNANEGGTYTQEEVFYDYADKGKIKINTKRHRDGEFRFDENLTSKSCVYDMVSVVYYARTLDFDKLKKGEKASLDFISGKDIRPITIEYKGSKRIKAKDGKQYDTLELSLSFLAGGGSAQGKEMMKVYISDDKNRIPIQLEMNLKKIGSILGMLSSSKGLRN